MNTLPSEVMVDYSRWSNVGDSDSDSDGSVPDLANDYDPDCPNPHCSTCKEASAKQPKKKKRTKQRSARDKTHVPVLRTTYPKGSPCEYREMDTASEDEYEKNNDGGIMGMVQKMSMNSMPSESAIREQETAIKMERRRLKSVFDQQMLHTKDFIIHVRLLGIVPEVWRRIRVPANINLSVLSDRVLNPVMGWCRNYHGYLFTEAGRSNCQIGYGPMGCGCVDMVHKSRHSGGEIMCDDSKVMLCMIMPHVGSIVKYTYDLGDNWRHHLRLVAIVDRPTMGNPESYVKSLDACKIGGKTSGGHKASRHSTMASVKLFRAVEVLGGGRSCPPEDCGGMHKYCKQLEILREPTHAEYGATLREITERANARLICCSRNRSFDPNRFSLLKARRALQEAWNSPPSGLDGANQMFTLSGKPSDLKMPKFTRCEGCDKRVEGVHPTCEECGCDYCTVSCRDADAEHGKVCVPAFISHHFLPIRNGEGATTLLEEERRSGNGNGSAAAGPTKHNQNGTGGTDAAGGVKSNGANKKNKKKRKK